MNILIVANHYPVCSARYAVAAFVRLGHSVRHIGSDMGRDIWGLRLPQEYVWKPNDLPLDNWVPDLTIVMDSDLSILEVPGWARNLKPLIVWGVDNHVRDYRRDLLSQYFLAHRSVSLMDWELDMAYLPVAYDPVHFTPSPIPWSERRYDVAVLGVMYPQRMTAVKELQAAGLKVIWGCGAIYEAYRDLHHNSRIALNLSFNGDVNQRVFETAALGNVVMSDNCKDFETLKPLGFWLMDDAQNMVTDVKKILSDPEMATAMLAMSSEWVKPHTWDDRAKQIVEWYERTKTVS